MDSVLAIAAALAEHAGYWVPWIVVVASGLAAVLDSKNSDPVIQRIMTAINFLAINVGKARNADDPVEYDEFRATRSDSSAG